ncbi:MAG: 4'-phosphopantetheinyl transferase superfamily protein [Clostridia bacterium]|nr:4'-phosphopantetheinyl transferase superfamily protein [Clostridia bacterium]
MHIYSGTDIIEVSRIKDAIENTNGFKENIYSKNEIDNIDAIRSDMKYQRYAGRFAAKEAIYKAMSKVLIENNLSMNFLDVEILNSEELNRRPIVYILNESIESLCEECEIEIDISISHISDNAIASAIVKVGKE